MKGTISQVVAGCSGMAAFAISILAGLNASNGAVTILSRAILAMAICYIVGLVVGLVIQHVIKLHLQEYEAENPAEDDDGGHDAAATPSDEAMA